MRGFDHGSCTDYLLLGLKYANRTYFGLVGAPLDRIAPKSTLPSSTGSWALFRLYRICLGERAGAGRRDPMISGVGLRWKSRETWKPCMPEWGRKVLTRNTVGDMPASCRRKPEKKLAWLYQCGPILPVMWCRSPVVASSP